MSQNPVQQSTACKPKREHSDSCMGNDQIKLSSILHEQEIPPAMKNALPNVWEDMVGNIFKDGKSDHDRLEQKVWPLLNGLAKDGEFRKTCSNSPITVTSYNNELQCSPEHSLKMFSED